MYENFYGFSAKPFSISPDPDFFYWNDNYEEAYALMRYCILDHKGIACITGEAGTGKTMLLNKLLGSLNDKVKPIVVPLPRLRFGELVKLIMGKIGVQMISPSIYQNFASLSARLEDESETGRSIVLLIDEAQTLDRHGLENLRLLSNIETHKRKLLQIVLLGQPELSKQLELPEHQAFRQRISLRYRLKPLEVEEIPQYIAHRMRVAGFQQGLSLFQEGTLKLIAAYSGGNPRVINSICENALLIGFAAGKHAIDEKELHEAAADLMLCRRITNTEPERVGEVHEGGEAKHGSTWRRSFSLALFSCFVAAVIAGVFSYSKFLDLSGFTSLLYPRTRYTGPMASTNPPSLRPEVEEVSSFNPPSSPVEPPPVEDVKLGDVVVVKAGGNISSIAVAHYGTSHNYVLGLIHMANPKIEYLDIIQAEEKLLLPYLKAESMVFKNKDGTDGTYSMYIVATKYMKLAEAWRKQLMQYGIQVNIVPVKVNKRITIYRLQGNNFPTVSSAVEKVKEIVPLQLMTKSMEEKNE